MTFQGLQNESPNYPLPLIVVSTTWNIANMAFPLSIDETSLQSSSNKQLPVAKLFVYMNVCT